ncbi:MULTISPECIES: hypothetical protein [unclassified Pseudofrankia]|uniref:hypothetical protein n=1 Tax=unclassified Pseudofrankia TaxID=2994372 RepID=UPI0008D904FC|nr:MULTISPECIES: hypothetical protein [unclassified Pseudofrankia]MDT3438097.1 hypothetical protein [Pseudofrankia sp. BMG5.37]OHV56808.1 hypothetical protein BCD48_07045 [Pseudofrankia sp. BMG5.36]
MQRLVDHGIAQPGERRQRMDAFGGQAQAIWEQPRQESNVSLNEVRLDGSEKANVRRLVMDVSVDDERAPALAVMSQGEQHSLALSLFPPRARTADSPFGFLLIDDPVQSTTRCSRWCQAYCCWPVPHAMEGDVSGWGGDLTLLACVGPH